MEKKSFFRGLQRVIAFSLVNDCNKMVTGKVPRPICNVQC